MIKISISPIGTVADGIDMARRSEQFRKTLDQLHGRVVAQNIAANSKKASRNANIPFPRFETGDYVLVCNPDGTRTRKQSYKWHGPFQIVKAHNEFSFKVRMIDSSVEIDRVHAMRLKRFSGCCTLN